MNELKKIPLRERKKAKTRLSIINAVVKRLRDKHLADITVEEICEDAQISKGTFFQYFPQKTDVMVLNALLWNLEAMWKATKMDNSRPGLNAIEDMFRELAESVEEHPNLWAETISIRAFQPEAFAFMASSGTNQITLAERLMHFPELEGIESVPEGNFRQFFELNLNAAIEQGDLPADTDLSQVQLSLACIFYGVPLMSFEKTPMNCRYNYMKQIEMLWRSLGVKKE